MTKPLSQTPPRIQRLVIRLQKYNLTVQFVHGKLMFIADTLSRVYLKETVEGETTGSYLSAAKQCLDTRFGKPESRNITILLSHNSDWTTVLPQPRSGAD